MNQTQNRKEENQDTILKCLAYEGKVSIVCADTTKLVEEARKTHDLSPVATAAFGRLLTMTALMGADMKGQKDKLTIQMKGNGPLGMMVTASNCASEVKGYVTNPMVDLPLNEDGKLDVGGAVGQQGFLNVIKDIGLKEPYIGISTIQSGEIAEDFAHYFLTSQQKPTAVGLGVLVDKNGVKASGGYVVSPMPDATEEDIGRIETAIFKAGAISRMLDKNLSLFEIAKAVSGDDTIQVIENHITPRYYCDCSKEHIKDGLASLGKEELETILTEDEKAETTCQFCNKTYAFTRTELEEIVDELEKDRK